MTTKELATESRTRRWVVTLLIGDEMDWKEPALLEAIQRGMLDTARSDIAAAFPGHVITELAVESIEEPMRLRPERVLLGRFIYTLGESVE